MVEKHHQLVTEFPSSASRNRIGEAIMEYRLKDDELGAAAQVVADRL